ncbi:MAG: hypothetical protein AAF420_09955, partial [Pseudomonadota bacterium]
RYGVTWQEIRAHGSTLARENQLRNIYWRATACLGLLWVFIFGMILLSVTTPAGALLSFSGR